MKNAYLLLKPGNRVSLIETDADSFESDLLYKEIQCDMIEILRVKDPTWKIDGRLLMIIDESGKLNGKTVNVKASILYGAPNDVIVGTALICKEGFVDGEPDCIPLTKEEAENLLNVLEQWWEDRRRKEYEQR